MKVRVSPRRALLVVMAASIPALLVMNVWQGVRYTRLREEARLLEEEQVAWFERNKELLTAIGIYSSPRRIEALAEDDPGTTAADPKRTVRVRVEPDGTQGGGR